MVFLLLVKYMVIGCFFCLTDLLIIFKKQNLKCSKQFTGERVKGAVSRIVEVEWAKFTRFFLLDGAVFLKSATFNGLKLSPSSR